MTDNVFTGTPVGMRRMKVTGKIKNGHITLQLELDNPKKFGLVNYLLELQTEGDEMHGFTCYYNPNTQALSSAKCTLKRQQNVI